MTKDFNFTVKRLKQLKNDTNKDVEYRDEGLKGLFVRVASTGTKTFRLKTWNRHQKKMTQIVLGRFPDISIANAREIAQNMISDIAKGVDIQAERKRISKEQTLDHLFDHWLKTYAQLGKKTWREDFSRYNLYIKDHLGSKKLSEITPDTIRAWQAKVLCQKKERGKGTISKATANRAFAIISTTFNECAPQLQNPCHSVKKLKETSRDTFLKKDELNKLFSALDNPKTSKDIREYVLISLYTGARRGNILSMNWKDIDFDQQNWTIPADQSKNSETMVVSLVSEVIEILKRRKKSSESQYVFPGRGVTGHLVEPKKGWKTLLKRAGLDPTYRLHDLRRTLGSWQAITGSSTKIIGASLGHKTEQATAIYARLITDPVRESIERAVSEMTGKNK